MTMVEEADIGSLSEASTVIAITPGGAHGELDPPSGRLIRNILIPRPALPFGLLAGMSRQREHVWVVYDSLTSMKTIPA